MDDITSNRQSAPNEQNVRGSRARPLQAILVVVAVFVLLLLLIGIFQPQSNGDTGSTLQALGQSLKVLSGLLKILSAF